MPKYNPNGRFSDCWSSMGEITFYHRDGVCYWKKKPHPEFPGTMSQIEQQSIHLRAIQAWQGLSAVIQLQWNSLALTVQSHRPPFKADHHISGYNLFVSAYHGFAQLGDEHVPTPRAYEELPIFTCEYDSVEVEAGTDLSIKLKVLLDDNADPNRYRVAVRLQLTHPGAGRQPGYLRSFIASGNCTASECLAEIYVPNYREVWNLDLTSYQVHMRYLMIDSETGYRNIFKRKSFLMTL